jgi:nicotinamidase-related amidase
VSMVSVLSEAALLVLDVQNDLVDPKGKVGAGGLAKIVAEWLRGNGVRNLHLTGTATNLVGESAARYTDAAGIAVSVVGDCRASPSPAWHEFAVTQILPVFVRVVPSKELH